MKTSNDSFGTCVTEPNFDTVPGSGAKRPCSAGFKMLFAATTIIAIALTYQTVKQAIGLRRAIYTYEENAEIIARVPVRVSFADQSLLKAKASNSDRIAKADQ